MTTPRMFRTALLSALFTTTAVGCVHAQVNADSLWAVVRDGAQPAVERMQALDYLAFDHYMFHAPDTAYQLAEQLVELARRQQDLKHEAIGWNAQGASLQLRGDRPGALDRYQRSIAVLKRMGDQRRIGISHANIGAIHTDLGDHTKALRHCDSSMVACTLAGDTACMGNAALNSGTALLQLRDTAAAYARFLEAERLHQRSGDERSLALVLGNLGNLDRAAGRLAMAEERLGSALRIAERIMDERQQAILLRSIGHLRAAQGRRREAIALNERSLALAQASSMAAEVFDAAGSLHTLYKQEGDLRKALAMHELYATMMDSLHNEKGREELLRAQIAFSYRQQALQDSLAYVAEREQAENARVLAEVKASNQRKLLLAVLLGVLVIGASVMWTIIDRRRRKAEFEREQAILHERMRIASDMHDDLGAGLSGLKLRSEMALRVEKDPAKRQQLQSMAASAGELIGSMRQIIWTMGHDQSTLEDWVVYTTSYARTYCAENDLALLVTTDPTWPIVQLSVEQRRNLFLVLKEALHNVVKHAQASAVDLTITYRTDGDQGILSMVVHDNGVGFPDNVDGGNGLRNMRQRLQALGGTCHFTVDQGTRFGCIVPFHTPNKGSIARPASPQDLRTAHA
ncbi:MAG: tetratricopeptide repeat protein, partial [Flavobacteriales bacterium]